MVFRYRGVQRSCCSEVTLLLQVGRRHKCGIVKGYMYGISPKNETSVVSYNNKQLPIARKGADLLYKKR